MAAKAPTEVEIVLPQLHPMQDRIAGEAKRFNVACLGRRTGKTVLGLDLATKTMLHHQPVGWFAPTYKYLEPVWREAKRLLTPIISDKSEQEHRLEVVGGGALECWTLDSDDPGRGRKYKRVIIDEAAIVPDLLERYNESIRPTLTDLEGDAWFLSTPKHLNGFYVLYERGQDRSSEWMSWQAPTRANPYIQESEIEQARQELPEAVFAQEYLAQFIPEGAGIFRNVLACCTAEPQAPIPGHIYGIGVDWGKYKDYSVFSVLDLRERRQVWLDRSNMVDYLTQINRLSALCARYSAAAILVERNAMEAVLEELHRRRLPVIPWTAHHTAKTAIVDGLALSMEEGSLTLLKDPIQTRELMAYTAERLPAGMLRYTAPRDLHDDTVIALALAHQLLGHRERPKPQLFEFAFSR